MDGPTSIVRATRGRPRLAARPPLTRAQVVAEALRLIDEQGISALTMRTLGTRLGVEAMSLYAYVTDKDDLLNAVADLVAEGLNVPVVSRKDWQRRIRVAVEAWAEMERAHPQAFPLLYRRRAGTERERAVTEEIMDALATAGFQGRALALAYQTLVSFLDGALLSWPSAAWHTSSSWQGVANTVDPARYPQLAKTAPHGAGLSWEEVFASGLDLFLQGLAERLATQTETTQSSG